MKKFVVTFVLFALVFAPLLNIKAQEKKDEIIMNIAGEQIYVSDFLRVYEKNNQKEKLDESDLKDYIELYTVYKLKVKEAIAQGLDTVPRFVNELQGYRKQLAKPYLSYTEYDENLMKEAYDHMKEDIRASHILIRLQENPTAADTLIAYEKVMDIRKRILNGESFADLAVEASEDPSARDQKNTRGGQDFKGNKGDLGYFSTFDMVYPFEMGAYRTPLNEVSLPVRTSFGYHLIKVTDRMPAMGKLTVAHILVSVPENVDVNEESRLKQKAKEIYDKSVAGEDFTSLALMYSDDKGSAPKGGELPTFGTNRMVPEFIEAIANLKDSGDVSTPVRTTYGWHIIKLINKTGIKSYKEESKFLKSRIKSDSRGQLSTHYAAQQIKKEFKFKEQKNALKKFYPIVDSTVFNKTWSAEKAASLNKKMFSIGDHIVTQKHFANYIEKNQVSSGGGDPTYFVSTLYNKFKDYSLINYKDSKLEELYPDFRHLMQEYHDGILLFDLTEKMVWNKAISDTTGLKQYYDYNKSRYMWDRRVDAIIYQCADMEIANKAKELINLGFSSNAIMDSLNKDSKLTLFMKQGLFSKEDDEILAKVKWEKGLSETFRFDQIIKFVEVKDIIEPSTKLLKEAKGIITADYQDQLEREWLNSLKSKYKIEVFDVINAVKKYKSI